MGDWGDYGEEAVEWGKRGVWDPQIELGGFCRLGEQWERGRKGGTGMEKCQFHGDPFVSSSLEPSSNSLELWRRGGRMDLHWGVSQAPCPSLGVPPASIRCCGSHGAAGGGKVGSQVGTEEEREEEDGERRRSRKRSRSRSMPFQPCAVSTAPQASGKITPPHILQVTEERELAPNTLWSPQEGFS